MKKLRYRGVSAALLIIAAVLCLYRGIYYTAEIAEMLTDSIPNRLDVNRIVIYTVQILMCAALAAAFVIVLIKGNEKKKLTAALCVGPLSVMAAEYLYLTVISFAFSNGKLIPIVLTAFACISVVLLAVFITQMEKKGAAVIFIAGAAVVLNLMFEMVTINFVSSADCIAAALGIIGMVCGAKQEETKPSDKSSAKKSTRGSTEMKSAKHNAATKVLLILSIILSTFIVLYGIINCIVTAKDVIVSKQQSLAASSEKLSLGSIIAVLVIALGDFAIVFGLFITASVLVLLYGAKKRTHAIWMSMPVLGDMAITGMVTFFSMVSAENAYGIISAAALTAALVAIMICLPKMETKRMLIIYLAAAVLATGIILALASENVQLYHNLAAVSLGVCAVTQGVCLSREDVS